MTERLKNNFGSTILCENGGETFTFFDAFGGVYPNNQITPLFLAVAQGIEMAVVRQIESSVNEDATRLRLHRF